MRERNIRLINKAIDSEGNDMAKNQRETIINTILSKATEKCWHKGVYWLTTCYLEDNKMLA